MISVILWLPVTVSGHTFDIFRNENNVYSRAVLHNDTDNVKVTPIHISPTQCTVFFLSVSGSPCHATLPPYPASFQKPWVCWVNRSRTLVVDLTHTLGLMFFCCVLFSTTFATQSFQMNCAYTILYKGGYLQRAVCVTWAWMSEHCEILFPCVLVCTYSVWPTGRVNFVFLFIFIFLYFPRSKKYKSLQQNCAFIQTLTCWSACRQTISCTPLCARRSTALVWVSISGEEKNSATCLLSFLHFLTFLFLSSLHTFGDQ